MQGYLVSWDIVTRPKEGGLEIRAMRQLNSAFLVKMGWRMMNEMESLWARVIHHKDHRGELDLHKISIRANTLSVWRGILENWEILNNGIGYPFVDGQETLFWRHLWVGEQPLLLVAGRNAPHHMQDDLVGEYWDNQRGSQWDKFSD